MDNPIPPFAVQAGEGIVLETPTGDTAIIKADTGQTNGSLTVIDDHRTQARPGAAHASPRRRTLGRPRGRFQIQDGRGDPARIHEGGMAFGPRGTPHAFQNLGDVPGRLLVVTTPSGLEGFFQDFAAQLRTGSVGPETLSEVGRAYGLDFVGPPVAVSDPL